MISSPAVPAGDTTVVTFSTETVLLAALVLFAAGLMVLVLRYFSLRIPGFGFADGFRSFTYLVRFSNTLLFKGIGDKERRSRTRELKANLTEAASSVGIPEAIGRLGSPSRLATSVIEGRRRPTWVNGVVAFGLGVFVAILLHAIIADAWVSAAEISGAEVVDGTIGLLPGATFGYERGGDYTLTSPWLLIIPAVAFLFWSRPWRIFTREHVSASVEV